MPFSHGSMPTFFPAPEPYFGSVLKKAPSCKFLMILFVAYSSPGGDFMSRLLRWSAAVLCGFSSCLAWP